MWATRIKIEPGDIFGHWEFVKDEGKIDKNGHAIATFKCRLCMKNFERGIFYVVRKKLERASLVLRCLASKRFNLRRDIQEKI